MGAMRHRVSCPWFVGRTEELAVLTGALDEVLGGGSATVLIGGDAGIGKTPTGHRAGRPGPGRPTPRC